MCFIFIFFNLVKSMHKSCMMLTKFVYTSGPQRGFFVCYLLFSSRWPAVLGKMSEIMPCTCLPGRNSVMHSPGNTQLQKPGYHFLYIDNGEQVSHLHDVKLTLLTVCFLVNNFHLFKNSN